MDYRIETDTLGEVKVPINKYWGAQTERSRQNFPIGEEKMPLEIIHAFAIVKKAAAKVNSELGLLDPQKAEAIAYAADQIIANKLNDHFPLVVWQTGSGTQSNMNVNEVIAHVGNDWLEKQNYQVRLHPNDDVNKSQSSNDTYPTALHLAAVLKLEDYLLPALRVLKDTIKQKSDEYMDIVKIGRTHLQDATPITLGQQFSGWFRMLEKTEKMIAQSADHLKDLAIGGTAVGTGLNAHPAYAEKVCKTISELTGKNFQSEPIKFHSLTSYDEIVYAHGAVTALATDLMKIANDVRWLASGPRSGIGEIIIPANEPGSSIMPGKVNPTQSEALTMIVTQVVGNNATITFANSQGNFELNVFKPVIAYNFLQSCRLLADGMRSFEERMVRGIKPNYEKITQFLNDSLMLVTALNPHIGYDNAALIANKAYEENTSLKEAAVALGLLTEEEFNRYVVPQEMTHTL